MYKSVATLHIMSKLTKTDCGSNTMQHLTDSGKFSCITRIHFSLSSVQFSSVYL